jgi:hypothetical protein
MYLQQFKWSISHTDGHVTTHKMLEFVNKRTGKDVYYKPPFFTMIQMFFGFILVALAGVAIYTKLQAIWNNWVFWLIGSLVTLILTRSSTSHAALALSTISSTMCPSLAEIPKLEKLSSSQGEIENSMGSKAG